MGCCISFAAFQHFSTFLEWALGQHTGCSDSAHISDNFLFVGPDSYPQCAMMLNGFIVADIAVPLAQEKAEGPF